ncbi:MAG TPA: hypothetical protein VLZ84_02100, partial [Asticcacaulis sp.]|nr:hypothetical protein [Asticcacaulis sp.]
MRTEIIGELVGFALSAALVVILPQATHAQQTTQSESSAQTTTTKDDGGFMDSVREEEAKAMASANGLASRNGDALTISYYGKPVISFTDHNKFSC